FFVTAPPHSATYPLSLHDALPIWCRGRTVRARAGEGGRGRRATRLRLRRPRIPLRASRRHVPATRHRAPPTRGARHVRDRRAARDRKSTRLNSSHVSISYAVFCLK